MTRYNDAFIDVQVDTTGLDKIIKGMPAVRDEILEACAEETVRDARERVPVRTGFLKSNIRKKFEGGFWYAVAETLYAMFVEFGTSKMAAQPYMRPAVEALPFRTIVKVAFKKIGVNL